MTHFVQILRAGVARVAGIAALAGSFAFSAAGFAPSAAAQHAPFAAPESRIVAAVQDSTRTVVTGSRPGQAQFGVDAGRVAGTTPIENASVTLSRSATQQAALDALIVEQQNPSSGLYHQWLTPDEFGAQFGASDSDVAQVEGWLERQGFTGLTVSRNHSVISFTGTVAQVEAAFSTEMHRYTYVGESHFAPSTDLSVPAAIAPAVLTVGNLSDFRPHSHLVHTAAAASTEAKANFTSAQSGTHFVQPGDVAVIYDVNAAYNAGYKGVGQTITVVGQSAVVLTDIANFQSATGIAGATPNLILYPGTGTSVIRSGDESESDLDLEYTSTMAPGATINFVYTGSSNNYGTFDALSYAVQNKIGTIISVSYGACEPAFGGLANFSPYDALAQQAITQGQTVVAAAGDAGALDCYEDYTLGTAVQGALSVDWPASSQYVTGMGGSEYTSAAIAASNSTYFTAASGSDLVVSAKSYIPEQVWNDDSTTNGLSSGGGGISIYSTRPTWQTGVPGITAGSYRLVPDLSLASSPNNAGYLYCSSDVAGSGITGSCSHGFRDVNSTNLTVAGGTSFAAPIFSGLLAIINQKTGNTTGQGLINPELYKLAANATTYSIAFHDITSGNNGCTLNAQYPYENATGGTSSGPVCSSTIAGQYASGTGYDTASGLGSIDMYNLMQAWPNVVSLTASTTTATAVTLTPSAGASDLVTFTVASGSSTVTTVPTGTIAISVDGVLTQTVTLTNGQATYLFSSNAVGSHVVSAVYSGDGVYLTSTTSLTFAVSASTLKQATLTLAPAATTIFSGTTDSIAIAVSPAAASTTIPTGSVYVVVDSGAAVQVQLAVGATSATATYVFAPTKAGAHVISVTYSGDTVYQTAVNSTNITVVLAGSTTTLTAATTTPVLGAADVLTFKVVSANTAVTAVPTGTISLTDNGTVVSSTIALTGGTTTYSYTPILPVGTHTLVASYSGDGVFSASTSTVTLTVLAPPGTFTVAGSNLTLSAGSSGSATITVTPSGGFTGTVNLTLTTTSTVVNACYVAGSATVTGTAATASLPIYTNATNCPSGGTPLFKPAGARAAAENGPSLPGGPVPMGMAMAGLLAAGFLGRRSRKLRGLVIVALLAVAGLGMSGCGSGGSSGGIPTTSATGTYTVTVTGVDAATGAKTATGTFTLTIQ